MAAEEKLFAVAVTVFIGDAEGNHSIYRSVSQIIFVMAHNGTEAKQKALKAPEVTRCIGDEAFDKAEVVAASAVPKKYREGLES